jgi:8-oxo-dGTP pyrophosphatase MutT (NUDIX family)
LSEVRERILRRFTGTQPQHELTDWRVLGIDAERSQRLVRHFPSNPVPAAVLVPLVDRPGGMTVLLTQRASQLARHAAQIAFPGGRVEDTDADVASAALREAHEEIGLDPHAAEPLGYLDCLETVSGYCVTPVVARIAPAVHLSPHSLEVQSVFEKPLAFLLDPDNLRERDFVSRGRRRRVYEYVDTDPLIWGATALMLVNLMRRMGIM